MSFVRPEVHATLWRWREVLTGVGVAALGAYWISGPGGLLGWIGWALVATGLALGVVGVQRLRFRLSGDGPGFVQVDEGQIAYFGPLTGGAIAASELERLTLDPGARPAHWILEQPGQPPLHIPVAANGADSLFDVFAALPGLKTETMLAELQGRATHPVVIWERTPMRPISQRLH